MISGRSYLTNQKYFKPNYYEALKYIVPQYLTDDDIENFGVEVDLKDQVINSNLLLADNLKSLIDISAVDGTFFSSIDTLEGISPYFVKQNDLTDITPLKFEEKILKPLGKSYKDFPTSGSFSSYVGDTLLPSIKLNIPTATFVEGHSTSDTHIYLIENLSWMYFLNTTGTSYAPSTTVLEAIVNNIYDSKPIQTVDGIKSLMEYVWRNDLTAYYPSVFTASTTTFTSGTQQLDNLKTWIDVIYSPLQADKADFTVLDRFEFYTDSKIFTENKIPNGPFTKLLRALSFFAQDINDHSARLDTLYNLSECPDEYLPLVAELIGWDLFGTDPDRWRVQLRNAVDIYQAVGTKKSLNLAINTILPKDQFRLDEKIEELYESYVPFLIYYALATESSFFKSHSTWNEALARSMGVSGYNTTNLDGNIKLATDKILLDTYQSFSDSFGTIPNQEKLFQYRGRKYPIPPFEEYSYYANFELTKDIIYFIADRLACFGCGQPFVDNFISYLITNCIDTDDQIRTSSFLFFTSAYNDPPNLDKLIASGYNEKFEYASLWSGKSSHFRINFSSTDFDFSNLSLDGSTAGESFLVASKMAKDFIPAHSIPLINLEIAFLDSMGLQVSSLPLIIPNQVEHESRSSRNYFTSGLGFNSYMRDVRTGGTPISRNDTNDVNTDTFLNATNISDIPRTTIRRRSYEKVMPFNGYYDRTGFNMPITFEMNQEVSGLPLGLVPSSLSYTPVTDHVNLPDVWRQCESLDSRNFYYEYPVSTTLLTRAKNLRSKNLIIFAGQSNMNGRGGSLGEDANPVKGVKYWDIEASAFTTEITPRVNTTIQTFPGLNIAPSYKEINWGPELEFAELLVQNGATENNYIFKFCEDNSYVVDTSAAQIGNLSKQTGSVSSLAAFLNSTWCPSSTRPHTIFNKFEQHLDLVINDLGGSSVINDVYFIWNQGETEAGRGQNDDLIADQHAEATKLLIDTVKAKFDFNRFKALRVKINDDFARGSEADWKYYPQGIFDNDTVSSLFGFGDLIGPFLGQTSDTGSYGMWSWSSLDEVRDQQESLDQSIYGTLLDVDDIDIVSDDGLVNEAYVSPDGYNYITPVASATLYADGFEELSRTARSVAHQNIHYVGDAIPELGSRLFTTWANETGLLEDFSQSDVRNDRGQLPDIYAAMHSIEERRKVLQASATYGTATPYQLSVSNVYQAYANSATEYFGDFPNTTNDYYNFSFGRDLQRLYKIYVTDFNKHKMNERMQYIDGANLFSHAFGPILYNHDLEDVELGKLGSVITSSLSSSPLINSYDPIFKGSLSYAASDPTDMYVGKFENVLSGGIPGVELVMTSAIPKPNAFSIFRVPGSLKKSTDDSYMFDNTFVLSKSSAGGLPRVRFDVSKYEAPSDRPIATNFLSPDHSYSLKVRSLVSDNTGLNLGGRQVGVWLHTKPEDGKMWSYVRDGKWVQHDQLPTKDQVISYSHTYTLSSIQKNQDQFTNPFQCIDVLTQAEVSPVSRLRESDFEEIPIHFNTVNRYVTPPPTYWKDIGYLHRKDQEYVVEVFMIPNGDTSKFMLLDTVKIQDMTLKKMSEIYTTGKYKDPLLLCEEPVGNCPEYRVELTKDEIRKIFKFFNDISGKNSTTGLASRDKNETETIMGSEGGSKLDYRYRVSWLPNTLAAPGDERFGFKEIVIPV
jgi:hypothetical protein